MKKERQLAFLEEEKQVFSVGDKDTQNTAQQQP